MILWNICINRLSSATPSSRCISRRYFPALYASEKSPELPRIESGLKVNGVKEKNHRVGTNKTIDFDCRPCVVLHVDIYFSTIKSTPENQLYSHLQSKVGMLVIGRIVNPGSQYPHPPLSVYREILAAHPRQFCRDNQDTGQFTPRCRRVAD